MARFVEGGGVGVWFFPTSNELTADGTLPLSAESSTHPHPLWGEINKKIKWKKIEEGKGNKVKNGDKNSVKEDRSA